MLSSIKTWLYNHYAKAINSIAFAPAIISLALGALSLVLVVFNHGLADKTLKHYLPLFEHLNAEASRSLLSIITAGSISIAVFSFSMVMLVLSQAASNYSPKILDGLIKDKRPQRILGIYIGTVVFCIPHLLLVTEDAQISSLANLMAIFLGVANMFLFIGFIDYVSRSVKPAEICKRIFTQATARPYAESNLGNGGRLSESPLEHEPDWRKARSVSSGYFQGLHMKKLLAICTEKQLMIKPASLIGNYVLENATLFYYESGEDLDDKTLEAIRSCFIFYSIEDVDQNPYYAYRQLTEVAVKAMSPGINDVGTARIAIEFLIDLLSRLVQLPAYKTLRDDQNRVRVVLQPLTLYYIFETCLDEIRLYSRQDKNIMLALLRGCALLMDSAKNNEELKSEVSRFVQKILIDLQSQKHLDDTKYLLDYYNENLKHYLS